MERRSSRERQRREQLHQGFAARPQLEVLTGGRRAAFSAAHEQQSAVLQRSARGLRIGLRLYELQPITQLAVECSPRLVLWEQEAESSNLSIPTSAGPRGVVAR